MKKIAFILLTCCWMAVGAQQYPPQVVKKYVDTYSPYAIKKMQEHKIPASITLAQGILESAAGQSDLAVKANNHFGIKCAGWTGKTYYKDDDQKHECFRKYASVEESYEDHSLFLKKSRYQSLFELKITDYKAWAKGLKACGYATNPQYAEKLIKLIEDYHLDQYDQIALNAGKESTHIEFARQETSDSKKNRPANTPSQKIGHSPSGTHQPAATRPSNPAFSKRDRNIGRPFEETTLGEHRPYQGYHQVYYPYTNRPVYQNNGTYFVIAQYGDTYYSIVVATQLGVGELKMYNDIPFNKYEPHAGEFVYLQHKKNKAEKSNYHILRMNESLRDVSQIYAIKLSALRRMNSLKRNMEPEPGARLRIR